MFGSNLLRRLAFGFGVVLFMGLLTLSARSSGGQEDPKEVYYVLSNTVNGSNRLIYILLDKRYFTEQHLRTLLRELFERYPEPNNIHVSLKSNLEQLRGFVGGQPYHPAETVLDLKDPGRSDRYEWALLYRTGNNEVIRYHRPGSEGSPFTVVEKGKDR